MSDATTPRVLLCAQDQVEAFEAQVDQVLDLIGHPEALVTDESQVSDFFCVMDAGDEESRREQAVLAALTERAGRPVCAHDRLWEIARDIHAKGRVH